MCKNESLGYENRNLKMNPEEVQGSIKTTVTMDVQRRANQQNAHVLSALWKS